MQKFWNHYVDGPPALGLLILRVVFGVGLMLHGWSKIQAPFSWNKSGDIPGVLQALAALGEFGGGLGILLGFLTPLSALGVLCTMFGAWWFSHRGDPWIKPGERTFELASLYGTFALALLIIGPGRYAIDALIWGRNRKR